MPEGEPAGPGGYVVVDEPVTVTRNPESESERLTILP